MTVGQTVYCHERILLDPTHTGQRVVRNAYCQISVDRHRGRIHSFKLAPEPVALCDFYVTSSADTDYISYCALERQHAGDHAPGDVYCRRPLDPSLIGLAERAEGAEDVLGITYLTITSNRVIADGTWNGKPFVAQALPFGELGELAVTHLRAFALAVHERVFERFKLSR